MSDQTPKGLAEDFYSGCALILAGMIGLWLAVQLLAQIWGWLLLIAGIVGLVWAGVAVYRWRRDRW